MKRTLKLTLKIASGVTAMALLTGCTWFAPKPTKDPQPMIQVAISNFIAKQSADYDMKLNISMLGRDSASASQNMNMDFSFSGDTSTKPDNLAFNSKILANIMLNKDKYNLDAELRMNKDSIFAMMNKLSGPAADLPKEYVDQLVSKWWKIPLPAGFFAGRLVAGTSAGAQAEVDSRMKDLEALLTGATAYLGAIEYDGADTIGGQQSYRYVAMLDNAKVKDLLIGYNKTKGQDLSAEELKQMDDFLANFKGKVTLWVSVSGEILDRVKLALDMNKIQSVDGKSAGKGSIAADLTYSNFGKAVSVIEPTGATEYDVLGQIGAMFGLGSSFGEVPAAPTSAVTPAKK